MEKTLLNTRELAKYLNVTERHIINLRNRKEIPFVKVGSVYRYDLEAINEWLKNNN